MAYKSITVKGKGKEKLTFTGIYIGKFERIGLNKLKKVDELRTSKGSQLSRSFQIWHTLRNQFVLKILNKFSQWELKVLDDFNQVYQWLGNEELYNDLARYAAAIHDLAVGALPPLHLANHYKKLKVRSKKWRKQLERPKPVTISQDLYIGDYDCFTKKDTQNTTTNDDVETNYNQKLFLEDFKKMIE